MEQFMIVHNSIVLAHIFQEEEYLFYIPCELFQTYNIMKNITVKKNCLWWNSSKMLQ